MSDQEPRIFVPKTPIDFQKMKLDRLMQNPEKPVLIPEMPKEKKGHIPPEFVRNVMGSSAGAGSGEFHVYRHLRRKEYSRQKVIDERAVKDQLEEEYHKKIEENRCKMEEKTAKKRAKRQKKKEKLKAKRTNNGKVSEQTEKKIVASTEESSSSEEVD